MKVFFVVLAGDASALARAFVSPLVLVLGKKGYYWARGILLGYVGYARGDRTAAWQRTYT